VEAVGYSVAASLALAFPDPCDDWRTPRAEAPASGMRALSGRDPSDDEGTEAGGNLGGSESPASQVGDEWTRVYQPVGHWRQFESRAPTARAPFRFGVV